MIKQTQVEESVCEGGTEDQPHHKEWQVKKATKFGSKARNGSEPQKA